MDARRLKWLWIAPPALALALGALLGWAIRPPAAAPAGFEPMGIAAAVLVSLRDEGRITPFSARFVAVAEASERRLGLTASKTLIMPGTVRYGVDLARLTRRDLAWDPATRTLTVTLPPLEISGPDIDLNQVRETSEGGLIMALTDAERALDSQRRPRVDRGGLWFILGRGKVGGHAHSSGWMIAASWSSSVAAVICPMLRAAIVPSRAMKYVSGGPTTP